MGLVLVVQAEAYWNGGPCPKRFWLVGAFVHELYLKKNAFIENGPWFMTLAELPICTVLDIASGEAITDPLKVPWA